MHKIFRFKKLQTSDAIEIAQNKRYATMYTGLREHTAVTNTTPHAEQMLIYLK